MNSKLNSLQFRSNPAVAAGFVPLAIALLSLACANTVPPSFDATESSMIAEETKTARTGADWSALSREARTAMRLRHYGEAEIAWVAALAQFEQTAPSDARVRATLSHLVRLASIYRRLERLTEAERVMANVLDYVSVVGREALRAEGYSDSYQWQSQQTLDNVYRPRRDFEEQRRDFEPTIAAMIRRIARKYQVDPHLVKAVVAVESNFDILAVSDKGAQGLMQLMPETAREMGVRSPLKPSENIRGGVRYLRTLLDRYDELGVALAAYNAGPVAVDRYAGIPPYPETQAYVKRVLRFYREYREESRRKHPNAKLDGSQGDLRSQSD